MHIPHVHLRCNKQSDINIFYVKNLCLQSTRTHKNLENLQKLIFFLHFTNVLTRKTRSLQNVYLNNGLKFNDGWGITLQSGGKNQNIEFFLTLSRASASIPYFTMFQITKKKMYISCPHFHIKRGEHKKVPFKKILLHHCLPKKNTYVCTSFVIPKLKNID